MHPTWDNPPIDIDDQWLKSASPLKIWHDDVRRPPDNSWVWCRTNDEVIEIAQKRHIDEISMDHDLGGSTIPIEELGPYADFLKIESDETGVDLANWLGRNDCIPPRVVIHSMNPVGAENIIGAFMRWGKIITNNPIITVTPFSR